MCVLLPGAYLGFDDHARRQVGGDVLEGDVAVGVLQQGRRRLGVVHQDHLEAVAVAEVAQLAGEIHVG